MAKVTVTNYFKVKYRLSSYENLMKSEHGLAFIAGEMCIKENTGNRAFYEAEKIVKLLAEVVGSDQYEIYGLEEMG